MISEAIIVATIAGGMSLTGTLIGTYYSQKRSTALITYRLEQLEKKVELHNRVVERTYKLEERTEVQEKEIEIANKRISALESR